MERKLIEAHIQDMGTSSFNMWVEFYRDTFDNYKFNFIKETLVSYNNSWVESLLHDWFLTIGDTRAFGTSSDAYTFLYYANEMFIPTYLYQYNDGKEIEFNIGKHHYKVIGQSAENKIFSASTILYLVFAAQILRSQEKLDFYSNIPTESLWEVYDWENNQRTGLTNIKMLQFFQHLIKGILTLDMIVTTKAFIVEEMQTKVPSIDQKLFAQYIQIPLLSIYEQILRNNQEGYEEAVYQAILLWKERFTMKYVNSYKEEKDARNDAMGYWALPIIAACAYAYDQGMPIPNIETGYLSDWMIRGDFSQVKLMVE